MRQAKHDNRTTKRFVTSNGLNALIVHDPKANTGAFSAQINAGHFDDPDNLPGLAHLLEHMLFLGHVGATDADQVNQFFAQNNGSINAWTSTEFSNFHFDVGIGGLYQACHMVFAMLAQPVLDVHALQKEIQSIDAEFHLKLNDDLRKLYDVHKETCNPAHPFSNFSVGNDTIFSSVSIDTLKQQAGHFHAKHYHTGNMRVCLISSMPLDDMQQMIESASAPLPENSQPVGRELPPLYLPSQLGTTLFIKPYKVARRFIMTFALPCQRANYASKPLEYISHLLGDEGKGSLLWLFTQKRWVTSLSAGGGIEGSNFRDFNINMQLTESGLEHIDEITQYVFMYLRMVENDPLMADRLTEKQALNQQAFDYGDAPKMIDDAIRLAENLFHYPPEQTFSADYLIEQISIDAVKSLLSLMTPEQLRLKVISPDVTTDKLSSWYKTPYRLCAFTQQQKNTFALKNAPVIDELSLPPRNPFINSDFTVYEPQSEWSIPKLISSQSGQRCWFAQDAEFAMPKAESYTAFEFASPSALPEQVIQRRLWVALVQQFVNHEFYPASIAGLHSHVYAHQTGITLHTSGFSHKQLTYWQNLIQAMMTPLTDANSFEIVKQKHLTKLQNSLLNKPINKLFSALSSVLQVNTFATDTLITAVKQTEFCDVHALADQLNASHVSSFFFGNLSAGDVESAFSQSVGPLDSDADVATSGKVVSLPKTATHFHFVPHQSTDNATETAVVHYFQADGDDELSVASCMLIEKLLAAPIFQTLRTDKQVGYVVGSGYMPINHIPGVAVYAQSPHLNAHELHREVEEAIRHAIDALASFEPVWENLKLSTMMQLEEKDMNLSLKTQRLWRQLSRHGAILPENHLASFIRTVSFEQILAFGYTMLTEPRKLVLYADHSPMTEHQHSAITIDDLNAFKTRSDLFL